MPEKNEQPLILRKEEEHFLEMPLCFFISECFIVGLSKPFLIYGLYFLKYIYIVIYKGFLLILERKFRSYGPLPRIKMYSLS